MKRLVSICCILAVAALGSLALAPGTEAMAGAPYYKVHCRGPFLVMHLPTGSPQIAGKKSPTAAGTHGQDLPEGTCAWPKRPLNSGESPGIVFKGSDASHAIIVSMLSACALDHDCVVSAMVRNEGSGNLVTHAGQTVSIRHL